MRISDWSSDVCSSDLLTSQFHHEKIRHRTVPAFIWLMIFGFAAAWRLSLHLALRSRGSLGRFWFGGLFRFRFGRLFRSEEHTSELQSLMRISYAVFCLKKKNTTIKRNKHQNIQQ